MGWRIVAVVSPLVIVESGVPNSGLFVYNGKGGPGNPPVFSVVAPGVTEDPFGNAVTAVMVAGSDTGPHLLIDLDGNLFIFNSAAENVIQLIAGDGSIRVYPATGPGAEQLSATMAPANGVTADGDQYAAGVAAYVWNAGVENAVRMFNGEFQFLTYAAGWGIDASFYSSSSAIVNSLLPLGADTPGSPGTPEVWHTLGSPSATGFTSVHGRYRLTPDGETEIDIQLNANAGGGTGGTYTYANLLPVAYQAIGSAAHAYPVGYNATIVAGQNFGVVLIDDKGTANAGRVRIQVPNLAAGATLGCNIRLPLN